MIVTKLFKIGEYSYYGKWRLTLNLNTDELKVQGIDYFTAEIMETENFIFSENTEYSIEQYLSSVSTSFWAEKMLNWVKNEYKKRKIS